MIAGGPDKLVMHSDLSFCCAEAVPLAASARRSP